MLATITQSLGVVLLVGHTSRTTVPCTKLPSSTAVALTDITMLYCPRVLCVVDGCHPVADVDVIIGCVTPLLYTVARGVIAAIAAFMAVMVAYGVNAADVIKLAIAVFLAAIVSYPVSAAEIALVTADVVANPIAAIALIKSPISAVIIAIVFLNTCGDICVMLESPAIMGMSPGVNGSIDCVFAVPAYGFVIITPLE